MEFENKLDVVVKVLEAGVGVILEGEGEGEDDEEGGEGEKSGK